MDIVKQIFLGILGISAAAGIFVLSTHEDKSIRKLAWIILGLIVLGSLIHGVSS